MKNLILFLFLILATSFVFSQSKTITMIDSKTKMVIPFVNVIVKNQNKGWSGNGKGNVKIYFNSIELSDSLIFSAVGYERKTIEYSKVHTVSQISLTPNSTTLKEVKIKAQRYRRARLGRKKKNKHSNRGSGLSKGKFTTYKSKEAKYIPNDIGADGIIRELRVYIRFGSEYPIELDVLGVNNINGTPTKSLLKNPIKCVGRKDKKWLTVNVKKYNVHIPENGFFIAVNWDLDSVIYSPQKLHIYHSYYINEPKHRIDTFFYQGTIIGNTFDKEPNWWVNNDSTWRNYWQRSINFRDTCKQCLINYPDLNKHNLRTSNKQTLAIYANILYSKSAKKYEENILDKEGIVSDKDQKKILLKRYEFIEKDKLLYQQKDVFQLFEAIKRALDSNKMNYIAHHLLGFNYESIEDFDLEINERRRKSIIYDIDDILKNKEKVELINLGNGFYDFKYGKKIGGKLLLRNGEWKMMVEQVYR